MDHFYAWVSTQSWKVLHSAYVCWHDGFIMGSSKTTVDMKGCHFGNLVKWFHSSPGCQFKEILWRIRYWILLDMQTWQFFLKTAKHSSASYIVWAQFRVELYRLWSVWYLPQTSSYANSSCEAGPLGFAPSSPSHSILFYLIFFVLKGWNDWLLRKLHWPDVPGAGVMIHSPCAAGWSFPLCRGWFERRFNQVQPSCSDCYDINK